MRNAPSAELTQLLEQLGLASPDQVKNARRFARSLVKDVPLFDSVWVDALVRKRLLTPFQAAEINAGRGPRLGIGPLVLMGPPENLGYARRYDALEIANQMPARAILAKIPEDADKSLAELRAYAEQLSRAHQAEMALKVPPLEQLGRTEERLWIQQPAGQDRSLREWLLRGGRLPGEVVLELARQMASALAELEQFSLVHGDISASSVRVSEVGEIALTHAGLRAIVRPAEGYTRANLPLEVYDYLAPERIAKGTPPDTKSDLFACGCLWWRMLTGRAPLAGGDSLAKVKAAHASKIVDVSRFAPEAPALLKQAITQLTSRLMERRGDSFAELAGLLGTPTEAGKRLVARHGASMTSHGLRAFQAPVARREPKIQRLLANCLSRLGKRSASSWISRRSTQRGSQSRSFVNPAAILIPASANVQPEQAWASGQTSPREENVGILSRGFAWGRRILEYKRMATAVLGTLSLIVSSWTLWFGAAAPVAERNGPREHAAERQTPTLLSELQVTLAKPLKKDKRPPDRPRRRDLSHAIQRVSGAEPVVDRSLMNPAQQRRETREILLPGDRVTQASTLEIHPGSRLYPPDGQRATIQVPVGGWEIDVEQVRFENVDFLPSDASGESTLELSPTLVRVKATSAQFHGCSFQIPATQSHQRLSAIAWSRPEGEKSLDRLPSVGHLLLANCILSSVHTGVDCHMTGPVMLELDNVLMAGPAEVAHAGTFCRVDHCPTMEDDFVLRMNACAVRDAMSLMDVYCAELPMELGHIRFDARDCVIAPRASGALLRVIGPFRPDRLMKNLTWEGQGSLIPSEGRFGLWYDAQATPRRIEDIGVSIAGLVRGGFEFAGDATGNSADSVLTHWAAPLLGDSRPGVRAAALPTLGLK